jgi:hypothetical protein
VAAEETVVRGIDSSEKLKQWFKAKGLHYVVLDTQRLCDALDPPELETFQQFVAAYEEHCRVNDLDATDEDWKIRATTAPGQLTAS